MSIISGYTDDDVKNWVQGKTPDQIAQQAASMNLTSDQIQQATALGGQNYTANDISGYAKNNGYTFGANGGLTAPTTSPPGQTATQTPGGMNVGGTYYSPQQIKDFISQGGDPNQFAQQHGITDLWQIHDLATQARTIAGSATPTGDAALHNYFKQYQQQDPNGAFVNDYQGWLNDQQTGTRNAMTSGTYSGGVTAQKDYGFGGVYGPGSAGYGKTGYASGLGPRGDGGAWGQGGTTNGTAGSTGGTSGGTGGGGNFGSGGTTSGGGILSGGSPVQWGVTPDQTVNGQVNSLVNQNSPLMQQARAQALGQMNDRGLVNSSLAITAGNNAAYSAALPIAQADAATYGKAASYNTDISNQFATNQMNRDASMSQAQLSATTQQNVAALNSETSKTIAGWNNSEQLQAQQFQLQNATLLNNNTQAAQAYNTAMSAINNIQNNSTMDAETKTQAMANVWRGVQLQINTLSSISGAKINASFAGIPGFDANGNWIGFSTTASTPASVTTPVTNAANDRGGN